MTLDKHECGPSSESKLCVSMWCGYGPIIHNSNQRFNGPAETFPEIVSSLPLDLLFSSLVATLVKYHCRPFGGLGILQLYLGGTHTQQGHVIPRPS